MIQVPFVTIQAPEGHRKLSDSLYSAFSSSQTVRHIALLSPQANHPTFLLQMRKWLQVHVMAFKANNINNYSGWVYYKMLFRHNPNARSLWLLWTFRFAFKDMDMIVVATVRKPTALKLFFSFTNYQPRNPLCIKLLETSLHVYMLKECRTYLISKWQWCCYERNFV